MTDIHGEYWIIDGSVDFADGDIGDRNHEGIAIDHIISQYSDRVESMAEDLGIDASKINSYGEPDSEAMTKVLNSIHDYLVEGPEDERVDPETLMSKQQADAHIMEELGCDADAYEILNGGGDARSYVMEHLGWIAVRSNNVELFGYDAGRQKEIADGVGNILYDEGHEDAEASEVELGIYDYKTGKSWYVTLEDLERPEVVAKAPQNLMTTSNKGIYNMSNPKDSGENMPTWKKSQPNTWNTAAQKARVIGPGQEMWRGTSEVYSFQEWLKLRESN